MPSYSEEYFDGNQLLECSMSLSPLGPSSASDLHVNNARDLPLDFRQTSINSGIDHILSGINTST
jgi:hypothetical protein